MRRGRSMGLGERAVRWGLMAGLILLAGGACAGEVFPVLTMEEGPPVAGKRVKVTEPEYAGTGVHHSLYLPVNYDRAKKHPIIVDFPGNHFPLCNSTGDVDGANLGYALTKGRDFIWVVLPFIAEDGKSHQLTWWGDVDATVAYAKRVIPRIVEQYNGDASAVVLSGFSRGAIAVSYIGLHDDEIAKLWTGFFTHDHFDGVLEWKKTEWGSPLESYRRGAVERLERIQGRPVWIGQNGKMEGIRDFLNEEKLDGENVTVRDIWIAEILPDVPNERIKHPHTDLWPLADSPQGTEARKWLYEVAGRGAPSE